MFGPLDKTGPYRLRCRMTVRSVETTAETSPPAGRTVRATVTVQVYDGGGRLVDERTVGPAQGIGRSVAGEPYSQSAEYNALEKLRQPILTYLEERLSQP